MKIFALTFSFIIALFPPSGLSFTAKYRQTITKNNEPVIHMQISMKDGLMRAEMETRAGTTILLRNEQGLFTVMPEAGVAFRVPEGFGANGPSDHVIDYPGYLKEAGAVKTGREEFDGKECDLYWFTAPPRNLPTKAWVWREHGFPLKETTESAEGAWVTHYYDIEFPSTLNDELFKFPPGVKLVDTEEQKAALS